MRSSFISKAIVLLLLLNIPFFLQACSGSSNADNGNGSPVGLTEEDVNGMIDAKLKPYIDKITALEADIAVLSASTNTLVARNSTASVVGGAQKLTMAETIDCALEGYLPSSQFTAEYAQCVTSKGFAVDVPRNGGPPRTVNVQYETVDCTGTPYVELSEVTGVHSQGAVFSYFDMMGIHVGYFTSNALLETVTMQSIHIDGNECVAFGRTIAQDNMIEVLANDVEVTGGEDTYPANSTM